MPFPRIARRLAPLAVVGGIAAALVAIPADAGAIEYELSPPGGVMQTPSVVNPDMRGVIVRADQDVPIAELQIEMAVHDATTLNVSVRDRAGGVVTKASAPVVADDVRSWRRVPLVYDFRAGHTYDVVFDLVPRLTFLDAYTYYKWDNASLAPASGFVVGPLTVLDGCGPRRDAVTGQQFCSPADTFLPRVKIVRGGDTTPPDVTISVGVEPTNGWFGAAATGGHGLAVDVQATDAESLVARVDCDVDGQTTSADGPSLSLTLGDGAHTVSCRATDAPGNTSAPVTRTFAVDQTAPEVTIDVDADATNGWYGAAATGGDGLVVDAAATDAGSSVARIACDVDGEARTADGDRVSMTVGDGQHRVACTASDAAGNESAPRARTFPVDQTPPETAVDVAAEPTNGWYGAAATGGNGLVVVVRGTDTGSSVARVACDVDGEAKTADGDALTVTLGDGEHTVSCTSTDVAGNESSEVTRTFAVDQTAPDLASEVVPDPVPIGGAAGVDTSSRDRGSGLDGNAACDAVDTSKVGRHAVRCRVRDRAGNVTSTDAPYDVVYPFDGFFRPVANLPATNAVKAGSAVPLKFSVGGDEGLGVVRSVTSSPCADPTAQSDARGSLSYADGQYSFVWKTDKRWARSCRLVTMTLDDGLARQARFDFG